MKFLKLFLLLSVGFNTKASYLADSVLVLDLKQYKINYPSTWRIKEGCALNECSVLSPTDTLSAYDRYTESIHLTFNPLPASYTAEKYTDFSIDYLPKVVKNFKVLEKKKLKPNVYRLTYSGEKNNYEQTWRQYYHVKAGKVYIVTFSAETSKYATFQTFIEPYLDSFTFK
jgi:hypothetical protein